MNFDILIKNGKIISGAGNPYYKADIAARNGKIEKIGFNLSESSTNKEINASGLVVCPGFIDPHSHSDYALPFDNKLESTIRQGIITNVIGNCGDSLAPINPDKFDEAYKYLAATAPPDVELKITWRSFEEYLAEMEKLGCPANNAFLVGFGTVRMAGGPGFEERAPNNEELEKMKAYIAEAMEAGAFGMSTGLIYTPQAYAKTEEIIELAKVVAKHEGLYFSHIRGEGETIFEAINEFIEIVEKSGCIGGQIAHHKIGGVSKWGASTETLLMIEDANARGINITCDQYPYNRGMTSLITVLPMWSHVGGIDKILERLRDEGQREKIKQYIMEGTDKWQNFIKDGGFERIFIALTKSEKWQDVVGKNLAEITRLKGFKDEWETLFQLILDDKGETSITLELMDEKDIQRIMTGRYTMIGTDGEGVSPTGVLGYGKPHPRFYGTYPRILGRYVREKKLLTLEEAIRKMTSFPAQRLGLRDRGLLREGMWADIVIFDPKTVIDKATFDQPHQFSQGIKHVIVNGEIAVEDEKFIDVLPGKVLRRSF